MFKFGSRATNPVDQWPDPDIYIHQPSKQKLDGSSRSNMNRSFPGSLNDGITQRAGYAVMQLLKKEKVNLAFDLHEASPEYPVVNAMVAHENASELAAMVCMELEGRGIPMRLEPSPVNLRGLSHREWGDAVPGLMALLVLGFLALKAVVIYALAWGAGITRQERPIFTLLLAQGGEFAFVVFQTAATEQVLTRATASLLTGAVALSMLLSPLLLVLLDRVLLRRFAAQPAASAEPELSEPQEAPVIIAGFGRYGQIVARVLLAQGIPTTVLDHSVEMLEAARTFGYRVHYGDATRLNLLRIAGAQQARILVVAVDAPEQSLKIVQMARKHFPHLTIVARARDITHWNQLRDLGVAHIERELFESSLCSARTVLESMGLNRDEAQRVTQRFRSHNTALIERMYPHHKNREQFIAVARQGRQQLVEQMAKERQEQQARQTPPPG